MSASFNTTILLEMAHLWSKVQGMASNKVADSTELWQFNRMAEEFPGLAPAAKLIQFAAFDFVNAAMDPRQPLPVEPAHTLFSMCFKSALKPVAYAIANDINQPSSQPPQSVGDGR